MDLLNLVELLDPQGRFERLTGMAPEDLYNRRLKRGWTLGMAQELKLLQAMIRLGHAPMLKALQRHWAQTEPDLVVSVVPNFNRVLAESVASTLPGVPFVTVMTDLADLPPRFWIEPDVPQHLVCGTPQALAQALAAGVPRQRLHQVSGMVLRPAFYALPPPDPVGDRAAERVAERVALGLPPDAPVGVVMFGGQGPRVMRDIARRLVDRPLILMCGHNEALAAALRAEPARAPRLVLGFTPEVPRYLRLADYFIGKPGPGALSEAVHCGLPVITVRNRWTLPQERPNTDWVRQHGLGLVLPGFGRVAPAVQALVEQLPHYRARVAMLRNRAVFEVVEHLADHLAALRLHAAA